MLSWSLTRRGGIREAGRGLRGALVIALIMPAALAGLIPGAAVAQSGNRWQVDFFANTTWSGAPVYTNYTNVVAFHWRSAAPGPRLPAESWSARMSSDTFFYAGLYRFTVIADDEFRLRIDGIDYFDTRDQGRAGKSFVFDIPMTQGVHTVEVEYRQFTGQAYISLDWTLVKGGLEPLAAITGVESVITRYGDYTRCVQQGLHQSYCFQADGQWGTPMLGMVQMEAPIQVWEVCPAGAIQTRTLIAEGAPQSAQCSLSEAGWFAR